MPLSHKRPSNASKTNSDPSTSSDEEEGIYEVETIEKIRTIDGSVEYFVKWKGWPSEHNTWEPQENMINCDDIMDAFLERQGILSASVASEYNSLPSSSTGRRLNQRSESKVEKPISSASRSTSSISNASRSTSSISSSSTSRSTSSRKRLSSGGNSKDLSTATTTKKPPYPSTSAIRTSSSSLTRFTSSSSSSNNNGSRGTIGKGVEAFQEVVKNAQGPPITIINTIDDAGPPPNFTYIDENIYSSGIPVPELDFLVGCDCFDCNATCPTDCLCKGINNGTLPYTQDGLLIDFSKKSAIFECNIQCFCGPSCPTRVVQRGPQVRMNIVRISPEVGWGVFAAEPIKKGTFIAQYVGEIITSREATKRTKKYGHDKLYFFDLDYNFPSGTECDYTIDALHCGNVSHFFNHSCEPNLAVRPVLINNPNPNLHLVAFFALRPIGAGEQLCFDYMGQRDGSANDSAERGRQSFNAVLSKPKIKCLCGTKSCRKYVYL